MRKQRSNYSAVRYLALAFWLFLILTACQGGMSEVTVASPTLTSVPSPTSTAKPATATLAPTNEIVALAGCTLISPRPTPGPTERSLLPPPTEDDWIRGPESATVTFTEYSDFQ
ncbi:MAG: hypothetical protein AB1345_05570 [Chloroflexota bacterium]